MNNARFEIEKEEIDLSESFEKRKGELLKILEAIDNLSKNQDWQILKEFLFDGQTEKIERALLNEAKNIEINASKIHRLNGNLEWAKRYDLYKLAETYKIELNNVNKKLNEKGE